MFEPTQEQINEALRPYAEIAVEMANKVTIEELNEIKGDISAAGLSLDRPIREVLVDYFLRILLEDTLANIFSKTPEQIEKEEKDGKD